MRRIDIGLHGLAPLVGVLRYPNRQIIDCLIVGDLSPVRVFMTHKIVMSAASAVKKQPEEAAGQRKAGD